MKRWVFLLPAYIFCLLVIAGLLSVSGAEFLQNKNTPKGLGAAASIAPWNAPNYYYIGLIKHYDFFNPDIEEAINYYRKALGKNPLYSNAWFELAMAYQSSGRHREALSAVDSYYRLGENNPDRLWNVGVFYLVNRGVEESSTGFFKRYLVLRPEEQARVYDLFFQMNVPQTKIRGLMSGNSALYSGYLKYLVVRKRLDEALEFWNTVEHKLIDETDRYDFCDMLIRSGRHEDAAALWREVARSEPGNLLTNGSFEDDIRGGCFGWNMGKAEGAKVYIDESIKSEGQRSAGVSFDGRHNVNLAVLRQLVVLEPDKKYVFRADIKTDGLSTKNGLFLSVKGYNCSGLDEASEAVTGDNLWRALSLRFTMPANCRVAEVSLRRHMSRDFDNKIKGNAWVDGIELKETKTGS